MSRRGLPLVAAVVLAAVAGCDEPARPPLPPPSPAPAPARNPILEALTARPPAADIQEGTAVLVLVDSSGSMNDSVLDAKGAPRRKIEIARRSVSTLVRHAERFAKDHPDARIVLGIEEFSHRSGSPCRTVVPLGPPDEEAADRLLGRVQPQGGTPIGDALLAAKLALDAQKFRRNHLLVITDGDNTSGYAPSDVVNAITRLPEERRASIYFVAFDVAAGTFAACREAGALVLGASNEQELQQTLDYVLTGRILAEQTPTPAKK